jgi:hypothetical protein
MKFKKKQKVKVKSAQQKQLILIPHQLSSEQPKKFGREFFSKFFCRVSTLGIFCWIASYFFYSTQSSYHHLYAAHFPTTT